MRRRLAGAVVEAVFLALVSWTFAAAGLAGSSTASWRHETLLAPRYLCCSHILAAPPCSAAECEHPLESPQWRKGPPQYPILCNACGTRWLRNGTLKPLVPRRGLRYKNKPKPLKGKAAQAAAAAQQAAAQAAAAAAAAAILASQPMAVALPPPCPSPMHHKQLSMGAQPALSSEGSQGGPALEADAAAGLMRQQAVAAQLPIAPSLQVCVLPDAVCWVLCSCRSGVGTPCLLLG